MSHLWNELAYGRQSVLEVQVIVQAHHDTQIHVRHTKQDAHLHLHAVQERQLCLGAMPYWVHTKGIRSNELDDSSFLRANPHVSDAVIQDIVDEALHNNIEDNAMRRRIMTKCEREQDF